MASDGSKTEAMVPEKSRVGLQLVHYGDRRENVLVQLPKTTPANINEICSVLQELLHMKDVVEIDFSQLEDLPDSVDDRAELSSHMVALLPKENLERIILNSNICHILTGGCHGKIYELLKNSFGDEVSLLGRTFKVRKFLSANFLSCKLVDENALSPPLSTVISVLNDLSNQNTVPASLIRPIVNAHKCLKRNSRMARQGFRVRRTPDTIFKNPTNEVEEPSLLRQNEVQGEPGPVLRENTERSSDRMPKKRKREQSSTSSDSQEMWGSERNTSRHYKCYICKGPYNHPKSKKRMKAASKQYSRLCPQCAEFIFAKRQQRASLDGKYALVTGGRIKIGYELVLKLLRDGSRVIVTTRFPHDAAKRYAGEKDYESWSHRLKIYPLDLKDIAGVHKFVKYVHNTVPYLDILINNAAQTISRPIHFFRHLLDFEYIPRGHLQQAEQNILAVDEKLNYGVPKYNNAALSNIPVIDDDDDDADDDNNDDCMPSRQTPFLESLDDNDDDDASPERRNVSSVFVPTEGLLDGQLHEVEAAELSIPSTRSAQLVTEQVPEATRSTQLVTEQDPKARRSTQLFIEQDPEATKSTQQVTEQDEHRATRKKQVPAEETCPNSDLCDSGTRETCSLLENTGTDTEEFTHGHAMEAVSSLGEQEGAASVTNIVPTESTTTLKNYVRETKANRKSKTFGIVQVPAGDSFNASCMDKYFPRGMLDADGQQLDLRPLNSWRAVLDEVPLGELVEVFVVNAVAPFILNKELKSLLVKSPFHRRFIVNVSAMEGQFNRAAKTQFHPHTNMAKAALNMMTRTAALSYRDDGIFMTSVDTGWVTDERPFHMAQHEQKKKGFILPLDSIDGAARIYDPVVTGLDERQKPLSAVFLKNYNPYPW